MKLTSFFLLFTVCLSPILVQGQVDRLVADKALSGSSISAIITDAVTGEVLESLNQDLLLCPASIWKLATTSAAIELLGEDFRFSTSLVYTGRIENGILYGDLLILGSGDPSLGSNHFDFKFSDLLERMVTFVKDAKIDSISGRVIGNGAHLIGQSAPRSRVWEDLGNYYGTGIHGLNVNDNTFHLQFRTALEPNKVAKITSIYPKVPELEVESRVLSSTHQADRAYIYGSPLSSKRIVRGTLPMGRDRFIIKGSIPNPALFAAYHLREMLTSAGIGSKGYQAEIGGYGTLLTYTELGFVESPPLSKLVRHTNFSSNNLIAEGLLVQLGAMNGNPSIAGGCSALKTYLERIWGDKSKFYFDDGSGLSRFTAVSAKQMASLLHRMRTDEHLNTHVLGKLPRAGIEGTVKRFGQNSNLEGNIRLKSGSMKNVKSYAGILSTYSGRELAFVIMINNYAISSGEVRKKIEDWLLRTYARY